MGICRPCEHFSFLYLEVFDNETVTLENTFRRRCLHFFSIISQINAGFYS